MHTNNIHFISLHMKILKNDEWRMTKTECTRENKKKKIQSNRISSFRPWIRLHATASLTDLECTRPNLASATVVKNDTKKNVKGQLETHTQIRKKRISMNKCGRLALSRIFFSGEFSERNKEASAMIRRKQETQKTEQNNRNSKSFLQIATTGRFIS